MSFRCARYLDRAVTYLLAATIILIPLITLPALADSFGSLRSLALGLTVLLLIILKILHFLCLGRINLVLGGLELPWLALILLLTGATLASPAFFTSLLGEVPIRHGSLASWTSYLLLYLVLINQIKPGRDWGLILAAVITSISLSSTLYLLSPLLPSALTPIPHQAAVQALIATPLILLLLLRLAHPLLTNLCGLSLTVNLCALILSRQLLIVPLIILGIIASVYLFGRERSLLRNLSRLLIPGLVTITLLGLTYLPLPPGQLRFNRGQLPFFPPASTNDSSTRILPPKYSLEVTQSALSDNPLWGQGLLPFRVSLDLFRPESLNHSQHWNLNFDYPSSELLAVIINLRAPGAVVLGWLLLRFLTLSLKQLNNQFLITKGLALSGLLSVAVLTVVPATPELMITIITLISLKTLLSKPYHLLIFQPLLRYLAALILIPIITIGIYYLLLLASSNYYYHLGLRLLNDLGQAQPRLEQAVAISPNSEIYRANLAVVSFASGQQLLQQQQPPLDQQLEQRVNRLLQQSLQNSEKAVELNPNSKDNWLVLASIYLRISRTNPEAKELAQAAYLKAVQLSPRNPSLAFTIGESYFLLGDFTKAQQFFQMATVAKPDYANGYYNLALTYRELGQIEEAKTALNQTLQLLNPASADYQAAQQLLDGLSEGPGATTDTVELNLPSQNQPQQPLP